MTDILRRIEKYDDMDSVQTLSHPDLAQDITQIEKSLASANDGERTKAKEFLSRLAKDIETKIGEIEEELKRKPQVMANINKTMEACLAYSNTPKKKETKDK
jgi:hypothetical protein